MAVVQAGQAAALADAFAALVAEGAPVTVRSLRQRARVGTDAAREWLVRNRPVADVPEVPAEALVPVLGPLWSAAITAAREEQAEAVAAERAQFAASEAEAAEEADAQQARAEAVEAEAARLAAEVTQLRSTAADLQRRVGESEAAASAASEEAAGARERAHDAEVEAAEARATARTLREIIDASRGDTAPR